MIQDNAMLVFKPTFHNPDVLQFTGAIQFHELGKCYPYRDEIKEKYSVIEGFQINLSRLLELDQTFTFDVDIQRVLAPAYPDQPKAFWDPTDEIDHALISKSIVYNLLLSKDEQKQIQNNKPQWSF
jgi:hypothetical protein